MVLIPQLNSRDIFVYPYDGKFLLYAPLSGCAALCNEQDIAELEQSVLHGQIKDDVSALFEQTIPVTQIQVPDNVPELTVLLNQICNFSCTYCYSARGRDKTVIDKDCLLSAIRTFVNPKRGNDLTITFSGGGDPMLSFPLLAESVTFARQLAEESNIQLHIGVVTNGSTLSDEKIDFIRCNRINLVVSCDILEDVHNAQRSQYNIVSDTIDKVCAKGVEVGLRSTITPLNVNRMEEMVDVLYRRFPNVSGAAFEAVLNPSLFANEEEFRSFNDNFVAHIFPAIDLGKKLNIVIGNTVINNVGACKMRVCPGKLVLTPSGTFTACSRVASPSDSYYNDFVFGNIIQIDNQRYTSIMNEAAVDQPRCAGCIAKYHCSGGCLLAHKSLTPSFFDEYCRFQQQMTVQTLLKEIIQ